MSEDDEKIIKQDKLLFKLMMHTYDDENKRNELIDSKNSQMIAFLGIMLTIQLTLFVNVLSDYLSGNEWPFLLKISSCIFLIFNLLFYVLNVFNIIVKNQMAKKYSSPVNSYSLTKGLIIKKIHK